jgi:hypothetical protein
MTTPSINPLLAKIDALYQAIDSLTTTSPASDIETISAFLSPICTAYLTSMAAHTTPTVGRPAILERIRDLRLTAHVAERYVIERSAAGKTVFYEMRNRLHVAGKVLDPYYETHVLRFNASEEVEEWRVYACRGPIAQVVQGVTGMGPYKEEVVKGLEWEDVEGACCQ